MLNHNWCFLNSYSCIGNIKNNKKVFLLGCRLYNKAVSINIIFCSLKSEGRNENIFQNDLAKLFFFESMNYIPLSFPSALLMVQ